MLFGINWISPSTLPVIRKLIALGKVDFCEIMLDNFAHVPSRVILNALPDVPIALHIVASRFLEKSLRDVKSLANHLRPWIKALNPLYVSEHLVEFTTKNGRRLPLISELDYDNDYLPVKERISDWQALLDTPLLFENHASLTEQGLKQASFFEKLLKETGAGLLFDFSNAYVAEYNHAGVRQAWTDLIARSKHFHVAGFKIDASSGLAIDTHDESIAENVLADMQIYLKNADQHNHQSQHKTLTIEYDANVNVELWQQELSRIKKYICTPLDLQSTSETHGASTSVIENRSDKLVMLTHQNLHHRVFHLAKKLLTLSSNSGRDILGPFLAWADDNKLSMDWTMHLHLLTWLNQQEKWVNKIKNNHDIVKELLMASIIRWSLNGLDHVSAKGISARGILVASPYLPGLGVGLWKNEDPGMTHKIVIVRLGNQLLKFMESMQQHCYALSYAYGDWQDVEWRVIEEVVRGLQREKRV